MLKSLFDIEMSSKMKRLTIFLFIIISSCDTIKKTVRENYRYEFFIDYKHISYQGENNEQKLYLEIDSVYGMWYDGKLIINEKDTFLLSGFEKGPRIVTTYISMDKKIRGGLDIWCRGLNGQIRDSLSIQERGELDKIVRNKTTLFRKPRKVCY